MSASGLPGSRVEAMRAGMRTSHVGHLLETGILHLQMSQDRVLIRVARDAANRLFVPRRNSLTPAATPISRVLEAEPRWTPSNSTRSWARSWAPACSCSPSTSPLERSSRPASRPSRATTSRCPTSRAPISRRRPAEPEVPIEQLLAKADVGRGENSAKKCAACHTFNKGGRNLVGPNLWGDRRSSAGVRGRLQLFGAR